MIHNLSILINAAALVYGGVIDHRRREIPNLVPIVLLLTGALFGQHTFWCIMGLLAPAALLLIAAHITKSEVSGGDFKLLCSLGFVCGLRELGAIIFLAGLGAIVYGMCKRLLINRHIPLCSYIAPAYITLHVIALMPRG